MVVQHPREQFHPLNTARIAEKSLKNSTLIRARLSEVGEALVREQVSPDAAILYPSDDAEPLESMHASKFPKEVIVLDGTWHHAKTLLRDVPELREYRRIRFNPTSPSEYRIRKEPKEDYLSTIESVAYVLELIEAETPGIDGLRGTFREMIDRNLAARRPSEEGLRFQSRRKARGHRFPEALGASKVVILYCEGTSRFAKAGAPYPDGGKEPLVVHAKKLDTGEEISFLLKTVSPAPVRLLGHLGLTPEAVEQRGVAPKDAAEELRSFVGESHTVVAWNASSQAILQELGVEAPSRLVLKGAYCDWMLFQLDASEPRPKSWGSMSEILERHDIECSLPSTPGRAERRLAQTAAIFSWICQEMHQHCPEN